MVPHLLPSIRKTYSRTESSQRDHGVATPHLISEEDLAKMGPVYLEFENYIRSTLEKNAEN